MFKLKKKINLRFKKKFMYAFETHFYMVHHLYASALASAGKYPSTNIEFLRFATFMGLHVILKGIQSVEFPSTNITFVTFFVCMCPHVSL